MRIGKKPAQERLAHLVKEVGRAFDRALQMRLTEHEVSMGHWTFLRVLWAADGLTQRELSEEAGVMEPTTFAALKAMERCGYVVRRPVAGDRRKRQVFLTARGRALEARLVPLAKDVNAIAAREVPAADVAATRRTLLALLANLVADEAAGGTGRRVPSTRELGRLVERAAASAPRHRS
jgi:DNA-binding MarR family transcriptional regulator